MSKRAAIYTRVSTDLQRDNYSIPSQIDECLQHATQREYSIVGNRWVDASNGHDLPEYREGALLVYADDYTSRELSRPALDAALEFCGTYGFDVLLVHSLDRMARDPYIRQSLENEFRRFGAKVEYVRGNYDETPEGEVRKDLDAVFGKWENAKRVERCNRGKRRKAQDGKFVAGRAPYGYTIDPDVPGGLAINEKQAAVVRHIFRQYLEGHSMHEIARELTLDQEVVSYSGNTKWAKSSVARILDNETYAGVCYYNKNQRDGRQVLPRDRGEWMPIAVTPLIDRGAWETVQELREHNAICQRRQPKRFYLLTGLIFCAECKRQYITQCARAGRHRRANDTPYYRHRPRAGHCVSHTVSARVVDAEVQRQLEVLLFDTDNLRVGYEEVTQELKDQQGRTRRHIVKLYEDMQKAEMQLDNLLKAYTDPDLEMSKAKYIEQRRALLDEQEAIQREVAKFEQTLGKPLQPWEDIEKFIADIAAQWSEATPQQQRELMKMLNLRVEIVRHGTGIGNYDVRLTGWFSDGLTSKSLNNYGSLPPPPPAPA